jgi:hypothetical protein
VTVVKRDWSRSQWNRSLGALSKPTGDDTPVTKDGRRLDTPAKILAWVSEVNAERENERLAGGDRARTP